MFIRSQKKNAQLVYSGFIYNKKLTQANGHTSWRCSDVSRNRCRAVCTTRKNRLVTTRRDHEHEPHWERISNRMLYAEEEALDELDEDDVGRMVMVGPIGGTRKTAVESDAEIRSSSVAARGKRTYIKAEVDGQ